MKTSNSGSQLKGESKKEVLDSIEELISMLRLLSIKVDSISDDSDLLPYIAYTLALGKTSANLLHKKFMIDQMRGTRPKMENKTQILLFWMIRNYHRPLL